MTNQSGNNPFTVSLENGKYTVSHDNGVDFKALRYGEPWRSLTGDGLVLALVQHIEALEIKNDKFKKAYTILSEPYNEKEWVNFGAYTAWKRNYIKGLINE